MYCLTIVRGAPPQDAVKYDGDQRCPSQRYLSRWVACFLRSSREDTPLRLFTKTEMAIFGG